MPAERTVSGYSIEAAQVEGYGAFLQGEPFTKCPYKWGTHEQLARAWNAGWAAGRTDKASKQIQNTREARQ
jgi:ribosome modulation factor